MSDFENAEVNALVLDALAEDADFPLLLKRLSEAFSVSVTVMNLDGTGVLHTDSDENILSQLYVPAGIFSGKGHVDYELTDGRHCRVCPVTVGEQLHGVVMVLYGEETGREAAEAISRTVARLYRYFFHIGDESPVFSFQNHIIARYLLLESSLPRLDGLELDDLTRYSSSGMKFCPQFAVAVFQPAHPETEAVPASVMSLILRYIPNCFCLREGKKLLALIYGMEQGSIRANRAFFSSVRAFCDFTGLVCGMSCVFPSLENRRAYIRQANAMICFTGEEGERRLLLAEEHFEDVLLAGAAEQLDRRVFRLSDVERVANYDTEHGSDYLKTLECYLTAGGRYTQAARQLFVDRGTLKYRMEKIRTLLTCDPDDPEAAMRLLLAIRLRAMDGEAGGR